MLKLMYISNSQEVARIAYRAGVDRMFVDLEIIGKSERQGGMDTVQSHHSLDDIRRIRDSFGGELLVRSNPIHKDSEMEIDTIVSNGADVVMLPYFKTVGEVERFVRAIDGRAKVNLLVETAEAVANLDEILSVGGIDEVHVGLNDLHLAYKKRFMFELLTDGTVEQIGAKVLSRGINFGFGGIAGVGQGIVPAERIIREHYRLGSSCAILSRAFCRTDNINDLSKIEFTFVNGVKAIRDIEAEAEEHMRYFNDNRRELASAIQYYIENKL